MDIITPGYTNLELHIPQQADYIFSQSVKILGLIWTITISSTNDYLLMYNNFFSCDAEPNLGQGFLIHKVSRSHATVGRTPVDKQSAHHTDLYLKTRDTHNKHPDV